jgi:hypothetical protein
MAYVRLLLIAVSLPVLFADTVARQTSAGEYFSSPVMAYVYDRDANELRALLGMPGAAHFSAPLALPEHSSQVRVAPGSDWFLADIEDRMIAMPLTGGASAAVGAAGASYTAFSPSNRELGLYYPAENTLRIYTGLPGAPELSREYLLPGTSEDYVTGLAVADGGAAVYTVISGRVWRLSSGDDSAVLIYHTDGIGGLAFRPGSTELLLTDTTRTQVVAIADVNEPAPRTLLDAGAGLASPGAIAITGDTLHVAADRTLWSLGLADGSVRAREVPGTGALSTLRLNGALLLDAPRGAPAWILSDLANEGQLSFVPAVVNEESVQ